MSDELSQGELLPEGWMWARLEDLASAEPNAITDGPFGSKLKTADYVDSGVRVVRLGNIGVGEFLDDDVAFISTTKFSKLQKHEVRAGDLVIAALAEPVGRCAEIPEALGPAIVKADCVRFKAHELIEPRYVMHCLNSPQGLRRAEEASHGVGRLRVNVGDIRSLPVPLAPAPEQRRILTKIEEVRSRERRIHGLLREVSALLDRLRQSVLAAAFRGDLTADWREAHPGVEPADELLRRIRAARRRRWEEAELEKMRRKGRAPLDDRWKARYEEPEPVDDSELPELPAGWVWASLEEISSGLHYGSSTKLDSNPSGVAVLRMGNVSEGELDLRELKYLPSDHDEFPGLLLEPGDLLFNRTNSLELVGKSAVYQGRPYPCSFASYLLRVRLVGYSSILLSHYINSPRGQSWTLSVASQQVGQANVNASKLRRLVVPVPPELEQNELIRRIFGYLEAAKIVRRESDAALLALASLDRSILSKAFRGKLVPQDPSDESAAALLQRIRAERNGGGGARQRQGRRGHDEQAALPLSKE